MPDRKNIALALSGGGVRAMAFHAGVLLYLAERNYLEVIEQISSVSGGGLLVGLIYKENNYRWPTSKEYCEHVYVSIRNKICTTNLQFSILVDLIKPKNWVFFLSRANILAKSIERIWRIDKKISEIGRYPTWSINGTTAENGKRFRFKHDTCGDYLVGYCDAREFKLAEAIAVSAAFPGGIGPLAIRTDKYIWKKREKWNDPEEAEVIIKSPYKRLHIYDGGLYDNLGTEPLFDISLGRPKKSNCAILVSDAGSPLTKFFSLGPFNPFRLKRIIDITMDQARSLRVRSFMKYLATDKKAGGYIMIGQYPREILRREEMEGHTWQSDDDIKLAASYGTNLLKISPERFDKIARHGYELAKAIDIIKNGLVEPV